MKRTLFASASPPVFYIRQLWVMNACSAYRAYFWARDRELVLGFGLICFYWLCMCTEYSAVGSLFYHA